MSLELYTTDEENARLTAEHLAAVELDHDLEYLRLVATGDNSYTATVKARAEYGPQIHRARADYEVALARLRR